ncbi:MAG TPA: hypothetical protein VHH72_08315 [Solirubrobacterales bacterium]|nr:hypothetical protein [Solirubrobacterales bacterium]
MSAELRSQLGQPVGIELGTDREWRLEAVRKVLGAGDAEQVRPIDVGDIEGDGNTRDPLRLRDQLLREDGRGYGVEDLDRVQGESLPAAEAARREEAVRRALGLALRAAANRGEQVVPAGEAPVDGRAGDARSRRDLRKARVRCALEEMSGGLEDSLLVPLSVGAAWAFAFAGGDDGGVVDLREVEQSVSCNRPVLRRSGRREVFRHPLGAKRFSDEGFQEADGP